MHPFREGNGRVTRAWLGPARQRAGLHLDSNRIDRDQWRTASIESTLDPANTGRLQQQIAGALVPLERSRSITSEQSVITPRSRTRDRTRDDDRGR